MAMLQLKLGFAQKLLDTVSVFCSLDSGNDNVKRSGGGYGIWIGRGVAEFADFKVLDVEPYS